MGMTSSHSGSVPYAPERSPYSSILKRAISCRRSFSWSTSSFQTATTSFVAESTHLALSRSRFAANARLCTSSAASCTALWLRFANCSGVYPPRSVPKRSRAQGVGFSLLGAARRGRLPLAASLTAFQTSFWALLERVLRSAGVRAKWALAQRVRSAAVGRGTV